MKLQGTNTVNNVLKILGLAQKFRQDFRTVKSLKMARKKKNIKMDWQKRNQSKVSTSAPPPPWIELPLDVTANILQRLGVVDLIENAQRVCKTWRSVCKDPVMWRKIDFLNVDDFNYDLAFMCKHVVDLSQGQLVDLRIDCFASNDLLHYIAERSCQLQCLSFASCCNISVGGLTEAVKRFPLLEELHLFHSEVPSESIETVGRSCPLLKSFSYGGALPLPDKRDYRDPRSLSNTVAVAIAKTMPGLRHLGLFGNVMTDDGLLAILDGCPHLETLDLRRCFGVKLEGDLGKRCPQQLKCLRRPNDSVADHEYYDCCDFDDDECGASDDGLISDDEFYSYDANYDDFMGMHWF